MTRSICQETAFKWFPMQALPDRKLLAVLIHVILVLQVGLNKTLINGGSAYESSRPESTVTGYNTDASGSTQFTGYADGAAAVVGRHLNDVLTLDDVVFDTGRYSFTATIDASACEDI